MAADPRKTTDNSLALQRSEEKFRILFERSPIGMAMVDNATGAFLEVNESILKSIGYSRDEFLSLSFWDITPKEYEDQELSQLKSLKETGCFGPNEKEYIRKDGSRYPIKISGFLLTDVDGREVVWGLIEDISKQKNTEKIIKQLAFHDPLTGLPNRRLLSDRVQQSIDKAKRAGTRGALMICDLDKFKPVNDTYGHEIGDLLLKEVASRVKGNVLNRKTDTFSRIGGDEFVILLPDISSDFEVRNIATKVLCELRSDFIINSHKINISCSIGISIFPDQGADEISLMRIADAAMYKVKTTGCDGYMVGRA